MAEDIISELALKEFNLKGQSKLFMFPKVTKYPSELLPNQCSLFNTNLQKMFNLFISPESLQESCPWSVLAWLVLVLVWNVLVC